MPRQLLLLILFLFLGASSFASTQPLWQQLPPPPPLPASAQSGYAPINGNKIWYAVYGKGQLVILLHGGLANSTSWGNQVKALSKHYQVIVMDSRGHGRSTNPSGVYDYDLMASDVIGLMDFLKIKQAAIVGWSDGAIIGLEIAIHHPERLSKLFAFGANSDPAGTKDMSHNPTMNQYGQIAKEQYEQLSPTPKQFESFMIQIKKMWDTQPHMTQAQLNAITVPTWIVDGDHDEGIKRENTEYMAEQIPNAGLLIQPNVSHYSFIQDPLQFNNDVMHFLGFSG